MQLASPASSPTAPHSQPETASPSISLPTKTVCRKRQVNLHDPAEVLDGPGEGEKEGGGDGVFSGSKQRAGVLLPIQPDERGFISLRLEGNRSYNKLQSL